MINPENPLPHTINPINGNKKTALAFLVLLSLIGFDGIAQITLTAPINNQVVQRNSSGFATISVTGYAGVPYNKIEGRLTGIDLPSDTTWTFDPGQLAEGFLHAQIRASTGWHQLIVIGYSDTGTTDTAIISRVGVGEVFLVAGNSNAMGLPDLGAKGTSDHVISFNAVNKVLNSENITVAPDQPMRAPYFNPIGSKDSIFPTGETSWYWGELGDMLYKKFQTPVLFLNAAWAAANSENYRDAALGKDALNIYVNKYWPNRQPYTNLVNTLRYFNSAIGIRAILWSHGENDAQLQVSEINYFNNIKRLIDNSRANSNLAVPWIIAKNTTSQTLGQSYLPIIRAQNKLAALIGFNTFSGPNLDTIQIPRPAHGHFENVSGGVQGLTLAATAWNRILSDSLLEKIQPLQPKYAVHTGVVPARIYAGAIFTIPYKTTGTLPASLPVHAELLNEQGIFVDTIGKGNFNPLPVALPVSLKNGKYQIRIVGSSPILPGSVSNTFYLNSAKQIDYVSSITAKAFDDHTYISWLVAATPSMRQMILEKTTDGVKYHEVQPFAPSDNEEHSHVYGFLEKNSGTETAFYRIRIDFKNGGSSYSTFAAVFRSNAPDPRIAFPNPVTEQQFYIRSEDLNFSFKLYDSQGRELPVTASDQEARGLIKITPTNRLPAGKYILRIGKDSQYSSQAIVFEP